ncbi:MAG: two-component sensor histidine kinase [Maricaulis sp.]|jgi:signal transduction histidine kinase|nr:two-component sensor histidine kinase [Maricaulis sp.]|tara:strand:- start:147 stop:1547 length:1401 start_codon:yes stop_codon:yes gene_type:complete
MWGTRFVPRIKLLQSTYFRFALALTLTFAAAYLVAIWLAFQAINDDLEGRVYQSVALQAEEFENAYELSGRSALVEAVDAAARAADHEDEVYWLGFADGRYVAGHSLASPLSIRDGDTAGPRLSGDEDDTYRVVTRQFGDLRLIAARSYEESDEIKEGVLFAFLGAALITFLLATLAGGAMARAGQRRIDRISSTLDAFAGGKMEQRVPLARHSDDLDRLSVRVNTALDRLQMTVDGIRQVSSDIAHDLRTPINRVGIQIEALQAELSQSPALEGRLEAAADEIRQIASTFDSLLRIAQIEAGTNRNRFEIFPLTEIASNLIESYSAVAEDAGRSLQLDLQTENPTLVLGDRNLLTQLAANLIENSIRHCPIGSRIQLSVGSEAQRAWIEVRDDGPGIPATERENVLARFYRLDKARKDGGSGLGLAIVKAIATFHKARLELRDVAPGLGVRVTFPDYREAMRERA